MAYRVCEETFDINSKNNNSNNTKYLKFHCQKVKSTRNGKLWRLSGRFQTLLWRPGQMVQNLETPGLSRRVDSTDDSFMCLTLNSRQFNLHPK